MRLIYRCVLYTGASYTREITVHGAILEQLRQPGRQYLSHIPLIIRAFSVLPSIQALFNSYCTLWLKWFTFIETDELWRVELIPSHKHCQHHGEIPIYLYKCSTSLLTFPIKFFQHDPIYKYETSIEYARETASTSNAHTQTPPIHNITKLVTFEPNGFTLLNFVIRQISQLQLVEKNWSTWGKNTA